ncbi:MAG: hypothetical protein AAFV29_04620 [Myxococcota bacterium]
MTTPEPTEMAQATAEISRLQIENETLRTELKRRKAMPRTRSIEALKFTGSFFLPMLDRQRVFRTFLAFFNEASFYTLPKEQWPPRERVLELGRDFGLAMLRFFVKRRLALFMFSLLALAMPLVQVWLLVQQNQIIENQNKYFNIQVYDIVAQSLTGDDSTAKQITAALLAREDFDLINGIIRSVFAEEGGGTFTEEDVAGDRPLFLEDTAARGHLVSAIGQALQKQGREVGYQKTWDRIQETLGLIANDSTSRVALLLRVSRGAMGGKASIKRECFGYLVSLSTFLRRSYSLSVTVGDEGKFFEAVAPLVSRLSKQSANEGAFRSVFVQAFHELLVDIALRPQFGKPLPEIGDNGDQLTREGFRTLVNRSKATGVSVDEGRLKRLLEVQ